MNFLGIVTNGNGNEISRNLVVETWEPDMFNGRTEDSFVYNAAIDITNAGSTTFMVNVLT